MARGRPEIGAASLFKGTEKGVGRRLSEPHSLKT